MKVYIGPYKNWYGPYQIVDAIFFWHERYPSDTLSERWDYRLSDRLGDWLASTWVADFCQWIDRKRTRKVKIRIDRYDTWNMDGTLSMIILPMLKQLQATKQGSALVDDDDVPEGMNLRSTEAPSPENEWDTDENLHRRWDWVMSELIWTFEQIHPDCDWEQEYYSGEHDSYFEPSAHDEQGKPTMYEMKRGPKDTFTVDHEGLKKHQDRINNGLRLFGRYYQGLWD
jgi:hypothetical protein